MACVLFGRPDSPYRLVAGPWTPLQCARSLTYSFVATDVVQGVFSLLAVALLASAAEVALGGGSLYLLWIVSSVLGAAVARQGTLLAGSACVTLALGTATLVAGAGRARNPRATWSLLTLFSLGVGLVNGFPWIGLLLAAAAGAGLAAWRRAVGPSPGWTLSLLVVFLAAFAVVASDHEAAPALAPAAFTDSGTGIQLGLPAGFQSVASARLAEAVPASSAHTSQWRHASQDLVAQTRAFPQPLILQRDRDFLLVTIPPNLAATSSKVERVGESRWQISDVVSHDGALHGLMYTTVAGRSLYRLIFLDQQAPVQLAGEVMKSVKLPVAARELQTQLQLEEAHAALERGQLAQAQTLLDAHLRESPQSPEGLLTRGILLYQRGKLRDSQIDLDALVKLAPHDPRGWSARGYLQIEGKHFAAAADDFSQALQNLPNAVLGNSYIFELWNGRAWSRLNAGDLKGAVGDADVAIKLPVNPAQRAMALDTRGLAYAKQRLLPAALADFEAAIAANPKLADPYHHRGELYAAQHEGAKARADFEHTLELLPGDSPQRAEIRAQLQQLLTL